MRVKQGLLPGLPAPAPDLDDLRDAGTADPADELHAAIDRLEDIHRRQDALAGGRKP